MTLITNNQYRNLLYGYELSTKEREEFDYLDDNGFHAQSFLRYRGIVYDMGEFERSNVAGWDGQHVDTFFSAVLVKYSEDMEQVKVALYLT